MWICIQQISVGRRPCVRTTYLSTTSRVLEVLEHRDVLAGRQEGVVSVCTGDDGTEHDGLVGLVLEVPVVKLVEFRAHLLQFLLGRADLIAFLSLWPNS